MAPRRKGLGALTQEDLDLMLPLIGDERIQKMREILSLRTREVTMVMEGFSDPHNSSAVLRSCDAFGIQDAHVVEGPYSGKQGRPNKKVTRGVTRWLTVHQWGSTADALAAMKAQGRRICVAHVGGEKKLEQLDFLSPLCLWLGNEHYGPSQELIEAADEIFEIPMVGFVESFNVSVAGALCLYTALAKRQAAGRNGDLTPAEQESLFRKWVFEDIRHGPSVLRELRRRKTRNT